MRIRRGDVVLVDLTGTVGAEKQGIRPCLVVQNDGGNRSSPLTIVLPITDAKAYKGYPMQVHIPAAEMGPGGKDSVVEAGHIRCIDREQRIDASAGTLAQLSEDRMREVDAALFASLGLVRRESNG